MRVFGLLLLLAVTASGCGSGITVQFDYDTSAEFSNYKTFAWYQEQRVAVGDARAAMQMNTLLDNRIRQATKDELIARGMTEDEENPDVIVIYHTGIEDKVQVTNYGYGYGGYGYHGWGGRSVDVYQYQEGTLIIDLIDAKNQQLAWRGWATGVVDDRPDPERQEEDIQRVMSRIFENYPPPGYHKVTGKG